MKILAFDSSNQPLTVAVIEDNVLLSEQIINVKRNHSLQLMPAIDETLKQANVKITELDRIAVAAGPGSYTGLRIAVTIAKSIAWAHDIELIGISSLKVLAANSFNNTQKMIVPLFDARRDNIYTGLYQRDVAGELIQIEADTHIGAEEWAVYLAQKYSNYSFEIIGSDAEKFFPIFQNQLKGKVQLAPKTQHLPRASALAFLAAHEKTVDPHSFTPIYLKLAEAEENWLKEHPEFKGGTFVEKI